MPRSARGASWLAAQPPTRPPSESRVKVRPRFQRVRGGWRAGRPTAETPAATGKNAATAGRSGTPTTRVESPGREAGLSLSGAPGYHPRSTRSTERVDVVLGTGHLRESCDTT